VEIGNPAIAIKPNRGSGVDGRPAFA